MLRIIGFLLLVSANMASAESWKGYCQIGVDGEYFPMEMTPPSAGDRGKFELKFDDHIVRVVFRPGFGMTFVEMALISGGEQRLSTTYWGHGYVDAASTDRQNSHEDWQLREGEIFDALHFETTVEGKPLRCEYNLFRVDL